MAYSAVNPRRPSVGVKIGHVKMGGGAPVVVPNETK